MPYPTNEQAFVLLKIMSGVAILIVVLYGNFSGKLSPEASVTLIGAIVGIARIAEGFNMHNQNNNGNGSH